MPAWQDDIEQIAANIRLRVFDHVLRNDEGYLSQALSASEIFAMLYGRVLRLGPVEGPLTPDIFRGTPGAGKPDYATGARFNGAPAPQRDRFIFSPAHYALVLYAALIEVGRLSEDALDSFNQDGSTVEMIGAEHSPGIETTTGSLAQAISQAAGIALGRRMKGHTGDTWVMMSDGEFQEGQTWEALAFAAFHKLDHLKVIVDANGQQCDGAMTSVGLIDPLADRATAFGWEARDVDGHDLAALDNAMNRPSDRPLLVIARTNPTNRLPLYAERAPLLHTLRFSSPEDKARFQQAYEEMAAQ
ncbi:MAG: 1-deoxy-D-xylulose-5-phosphate synthase N-terminal domain-containing protein [Propionicimonas sp.]